MRFAYAEFFQGQSSAGTSIASKRAAEATAGPAGFELGFLRRFEKRSRSRLASGVRFRPFAQAILLTRTPCLAREEICHKTLFRGSASPLETGSLTLLRRDRDSSAGMRAMVVTTTINRPLGRYPIAPYRAGGYGGSTHPTAARTAASLTSLGTARIRQVHESTAARLTAATAALSIASKACECGGSNGHEPPQNRRMRFRGIFQVVSCLALKTIVFTSICLIS